MKKLLTFIFAFISLVSYSQEKVYIGGSFGVSHNTDNDITSIKISPEIGFTLNSRFDLGTYIGYRYIQENIDDGRNSYSFSASPYLRYFANRKSPFNFFVEGGVGYSYSDMKFGQINKKKNGFEIGLKPGITFELGSKVRFISKIGFLGYRNSYQIYDTGYDASISLDNIDFGLVVNL